MNARNPISVAAGRFGSPLPEAKGRPARRAKRGDAGFTLVELLVVMTIIAVLTTLLLSAIWSVLGSARRVQCNNRLRQLAQAAHTYHTARESFPPGVDRSSSQGVSLFVFLLPYLDRAPLHDQWDFANPVNNSVGGTDARAATVLPELLCPSDEIVGNPVMNPVSGKWYGMTSYGGNGGTRSFHPDCGALMTDGVFFTAGKYSYPQPDQMAVRLSEITDGVSSTLLFGERSHVDRNYDTFASRGWEQTMGQYGYWTGSGGHLALGDVTLSGYAPINYRVPTDYGKRKTAKPPASSAKEFRYYADLRVCAFGSNHSGGANFAFADGSVRFLSQDIEQTTLRALCTRSGREIVKLP